MKPPRQSGFLQASTLRTQRGYTLMEIMLVMAIIVVIAGGLVLKIGGNVLDTAKVQAAERDIDTIYGMLKLYEVDNKQMPDQSQGLEALIAPPTTGSQPLNWKKLMDNLPTDPWNTPYQYRNPGKRDPSGVDVYSLGPQRKEGDGDIYRRNR